MKNPSSVNIAGEFEADALRILREIAGLDVTLAPAPPDGHADAVLHFADANRSIAVEVKARANTATAWQLVRRLEDRPDLPLLLIAGETTSDARRILEAHGIAVVDGLGNAHIEFPGLLIHLEGRQRRPRTGRRRLRGKAGVAVQAMLLHPGRAWQVQGLASEAHVSTGLAHSVLARLEDERIVLPEGSGPRRVRRVVDPSALLDLWVEESVDRPRMSLGHVLAQAPRQLMDRVGNGLGHAGVEYALTGPAGASFVAPYVTSIPIVDVWVEATAAIEELYDATGADLVDGGHNVVFLQAKDDSPLTFRERVDELWVANRFRLYLDLLRDPRRGREQAEHLRKEAIGF